MFEEVDQPIERVDPSGVGMDEAAEKAVRDSVDPMKQPFKWTDDFQPLDIIDDRSVSDKIIAGDLTLQTVKDKRMVLYTDLPLGQVLYVAYDVNGSQRGDKYVVMSLYKEFAERSGKEVQVQEVSKEDITKLVLGK